MEQPRRGARTALLIPRVIASALAVLAAALALWLVALSLSWPSVHDAPVLNYMGWRLLEGDRPYVDFVDMNFPGSYLVHAAVVAAAHDLDAGTAVANAILLGVNALLAGALVWRLGAGLAAAVAAGAITTILTLETGPWQMLQRDALMLPFLLGATLLLAGGEPAAWRLRRLFLVGVLLGTASTIKPAAIFWGGAVVAVVLLHPRWRRRRELVRASAAILAGGLAAWLPIVAWLASVGSLGPFLDQFFGYLLPVYSKIDAAVIAGAPEPDFGYLLGNELAKLGLHAVLRAWAFALALATLIGCAAFPLRVAAAAALGAVAGHLLQGKGWDYHLFPAHAATASLAAAAWGRELRRARPAFQRAGVVFFTLLLAAISASAYRYVPRARGFHAKAQPVHALVAYFRGVQAPLDTLQILDTTNCGLDLLLRLRQPNATPVVYDFHVLWDPDRAPFVAALRARFMAQLESAPPTRFLIFEDGWPRAGYGRLDGFPELEAFLGERYRIERETPVWRVLRLKDG